MSQLIERSYQFRAETESDGRSISGYVAVFGQPTTIRGEGTSPFTERVRKGSFSRAVDGTDPMPKMMYGHGHDTAIGTLPIGRWDECREDDTGLFMRGRLFETPRCAEVREAIREGGVTGCSFAFEVLDDSWNGDQREIRSVRCIEAGPVSSPAYVGTSVGVRSAVGTARLTAGERARRIRELTLRAYQPGTPDASPDGTPSDGPSVDDAAAAAKLLWQYFDSLQSGVSPDMPPPG